MNENSKETEIFQEIQGFPGYLIGDKGSVFSLFTKKFLKQRTTKFGYSKVALYRTNSKKAKHLLLSQTQTTFRK